MTIERILTRYLRPEYIFLILFLIMGVFYSVLFPVGSGADEIAHIARVDQIANGGLFPEEITRNSIEDEFKSVAAEPDEGFIYTLYGGTVDSGLYNTASKGANLYQSSISAIQPGWKQLNRRSAAAVFPAAIAIPPYCFNDDSKSNDWQISEKQQ